MKNFKILFKNIRAVRNILVQISVILFLCAANINAQTLVNCVVENSGFEEGLTGWNSWGNGSSREQSADGDGYGGGYALKFTNPSVATNSWDAQVEYRIAEAIAVDTRVSLKFMIKGDTEGSAGVQMQNPGNYSGCGSFGPFDITAEWTEISLQTTITGVNGLQLIWNYGNFAGTVWMDNVTLCYEVLNCDLVENPDFETGISGWNSWGNGSSRAQSDEGDGYGGGYALKFTNPSVAANSWDAQVEYRIAEGIPAGVRTYLKFMIKGDAEGSAGVQMQNPAGYAGCGSFGSFDITEEWTKISLETTITGENGLQLIWNFGGFAGTVLMDDVSLCYEVPVPLNCDLVENSDFETGISGWNSWGNGSSRAQSDEGDGYGGGFAFKFTNPAVAANAWDAQVEYRIAEAIETGTKTYLKFMIKADAGGSADVQMQNPGNYAGCGPFGSFDITEEWTKISLETTITGDNGLQLIWNFGHFAGTVLMDDVSLCYEIAEDDGTVVAWMDMITNGDFEEDDLETSFFFTDNVEEPIIVEGEGVDGTRAMVIQSPDKLDNDWNLQFWILIDPPAVEGEKYILSMDIRADKDCSFSNQSHFVPQDYIHWDFCGTMNAKTEWTTITREVTITAAMVGTKGSAGAVAFNLGQIETTLYVDNVSLKKYVGPVITIDTQPEASTRVNVGQITGSLSVKASVTQDATLSYQWYSNTANSNKDGTEIPGATKAGFDIPVNLEAGTYYYYCVAGATGEALSVTSDVAAVIVATPWIDLITNGDFENDDLETSFEFTANVEEPIIVEGEGADGTRGMVIRSPEKLPNNWDLQFWILIDPPAKLGDVYILSMDVRADEECTFDNQVHYVPTEYVYWQFFGNITATTEWSAFTSNRITITAAHLGAYEEVGAIAFNLGHIETTLYIDNVSLRKFAGPVITIDTQPEANTEFTEGAVSGSLSVEASVTQDAALSYQWYVSATNSNTGGVAIPGATEALFDLPEDLAAGTCYYYCVVSATREAASVTSAVAAVFVTAVITVGTQPAIITLVTEGSIAGILTVEASITDGSTLSYQWYSNETNSNTNGTEISGATNAHFPIPENLGTGMYYYYCVVSASTGAESVTSMVARVNVSYLTGTGEIFAISLEVYPNPVKDMLYISRSAPTADLMEIIDMSGRILMRKTHYSDSAINISELTPGLYMLRLTHEGNVAVKRFTKE